jgi:hypothetical protein
MLGRVGMHHDGFQFANEMDPKHTAFATYQAKSIRLSVDL